MLTTPLLVYVITLCFRASHTRSQKGIWVLFATDLAGDCWKSYSPVLVVSKCFQETASLRPWWVIQLVSKFVMSCMNMMVAC